MRAEEVYEEHKKLIYSLIRKYENQYGTNIDFEGEANYQFIRIYNRYDKEETKFSTFLHCSLVGYFQMLIQKHYHKRDICITEIVKEEKNLYEPVKNQTKEYDDTWIESLRNEAKEVLSVLFETPTELIEMYSLNKNNKKQIRENLNNELLKRGWNRFRIAKELNNIKKELCGC